MGRIIAHEPGTIEHNMATLEDCVAQMMDILDPTGARSSTDRTPQRVARMFLTELCIGYQTDIEELFEAVFPNEGSSGMVVVGNIPLYSLCEHHWLLITGKAHVGYLPNTKVLGLSKVARVVDAFAHRLQLQERLTRQVADAIDEHLDSKGVIVVIEAEHHCLSIRGAQKPGTITTTTEIRGDFEQGKWQDQFFRMINR